LVIACFVTYFLCLTFKLPLSDILKAKNVVILGKAVHSTYTTDRAIDNKEIRIS
jgi:hypothetical protein